MESGSGERLPNRGENENFHEENKAKVESGICKRKIFKGKAKDERKKNGNQCISSILLSRLNQWLISTIPHESYVDDDCEDLELAIKLYYHNQKIFRIILIILTAVGLAIVGSIGWILEKWLEGFSIHPDRAELSDYNIHLVCGGLSLIIAPAYGMLMFRIFPTTEYSTLVKIHMILLQLSSLVTIFSVKVAYESHHVYGPIHLYSLHGWFGITISTLLFFLIISGNWMYFSSREFKRLKVLHRACGMMLFIMSVAASISGLLSRSIHILRREQRLTDRVALLNALGLLITIFGVLARYLVVEYKFRRRPIPGIAVDDEGINYLEEIVTDTVTPSTKKQDFGKANAQPIDLSHINISMTSLQSTSFQDQHQTHKVEAIDQAELINELNQARRKNYTAGGPRSILSEILISPTSKSQRKND